MNNKKTENNCNEIAEENKNNDEEYKNDDKEKKNTDDKEDLTEKENEKIKID